MNIGVDVALPFARSAASGLSTTPLMLPSGFISGGTDANGNKNFVNTSSGHPVVLASMNWSGCDLGTGGGGGLMLGLNVQNYATIIDVAKATGFNVLTIPYSSDCLTLTPQFNAAGSFAISSAINNGGTSGVSGQTWAALTVGMTAFQIFDAVIDYGAKVGMKFGFRRMWNVGQPPYPSNNAHGAQQFLWYDPSGGLNDAQTLSSMVSIANHYSVASNPGNLARAQAVLFIESNNEVEAFGNCTWGTNSSTDIDSWYSRLHTGIRAVNPDIMLICELPQGDYFDGGGNWGGGNGTPMRTVGRRPSFTDPTKIAFSFHTYPVSISGSSTQNPTTYVTQAQFISDSVANGGIGLYPVLATEFGIARNPSIVGTGVMTQATYNADLPWLQAWVPFVQARKSSWIYHYYGDDLGGGFQNPAGALNRAYSAVFTDLTNPLIPIMYYG